MRLTLISLCRGTCARSLDVHTLNADSTSMTSGIFKLYRFSLLKSAYRIPQETDLARGDWGVERKNAGTLPG